ncbi:Transcriptional regulatory protein YpdB [Polaribacter huanghezhanensis]|uniref:LytR/AlgR family response regulator transcription factor n=1 Tax=Polaribacter huanghezhanensis TaxID=1354726 RepID=UPI002647A4A8|nr:response regulator transcription factor [Polaribacter huanghezhanensis]WKD85108.1 Transcriptional regulatory protein YpdB [Polaribacter huanghezhanensis]
MKTISVYVVEDMAISRISLETMLLQNNFKLSGSAAKAETAWEELKKNETDLILLDVNLAGAKNGVWLAQQVRKHLNIPIIFLTAYGDQNTLKEVLGANPNGYLMKPYQESTLLTTISIALNNFSSTQKNSNELKQTSNDFLYIKDRNLKVKLYFEHIYFVKSDGNYLEVMLEKKKHVIRGKLSEFNNLLPEALFYQSHRRYLVNITKINTLGKDFIQLENEKIPLSTKYKKGLENVL